MHRLSRPGLHALLPRRYRADHRREGRAEDAGPGRGGQESIALPPGLAEAYVIRGALRLRDRFDWSGAQADFERALGFNPDQPFALEQYGYWFQAWRGQLREAAGSLRRAIERDPLNVSLWHRLGCVYVFGGDLASARKAFDREYEISSGYASDDAWPMYLLILEGKPAEALEVASHLQLEVYRLVGAALAHHVLGHEEVRDSRSRNDAAEGRPAPAQAERRPATPRCSRR